MTWWRCVCWLVLGGLSVTACSEDGARQRPGEGEDGGELPDQQITDFVLRETDEGALAWVLQAETAEVFEQRNEIRASNLSVDFYDEEGEVSSVLTAREGTIHRRSNAMQARGDVVVRSRDGRVLETQTLQYSPATQRVSTDDFVRIIDGRNVLTGYGLESDPDLREGTFEIKRDVQATVLDAPPVDGDEDGTGPSGDRQGEEWNGGGASGGDADRS